MPSPPPPRSLTPPGMKRETAHLCDCPLSGNMIELEKAGIAMPVFHYGFLIDPDLWQRCKPRTTPAGSKKVTLMSYLLVSANGPGGSDSRVPDFQLTPALVPEEKLALVDSSAKDECPALDSDVMPVGESVMILSYFSNTYPSYAKRLTQEEMDLMAKVLNQRPRWWRAYSMGG